MNSLFKFVLLVSVETAAVSFFKIANKMLFYRKKFAEFKVCL